MAVEVILPKVDMVMETGTFVEWFKQEGQQVVKGEPLFTILTDKAAIEIESPASGTLAGVSAKPDDVIPVSETIAYILAPGERLPERRNGAFATSGTAGAAASAVPAETATGAVVSEAAPSPTAPAGKVRASPVARRMAAELGLNLNTLSGRGPRGRIQLADVAAAEQLGKQAQQTQPTSAFQTPAAPAVENMRPSGMPALQIPLPEARRKEVIPLTGGRKIIAQRMAYSAATAPHITLSLHVDMSEATRLRTSLLAKIEQSTGQRLSFTAILARAVAAVLPSHPFINASLNGEEIICWEDVHLGIATSLKNYLIVPVIHQAQTKNLEQLVTALADLVERARGRRLSPAEMSGSTFTISNLGMFGIEAFTAIINPPESAILAVGKIVERQATEEDSLTLKPMMNLTLSADHRVIDGVAAAGFLAELKATLENPYLLL
jgi:pyruvate dehydrogenase E2 component (dihydrolipoamide acetyltransferase)